MKKFLLVLISSLSFLGTYAQEVDCFKKLEEAFKKRGSYAIADDMHRNVIISFFEMNGTTPVTSCVTGKVRVENGLITSIFLKFDENIFEPIESKWYNVKKTAPGIENGISEMIYTADGQKFKVIFIDQLKPKAKLPQKAKLPDDL